VYELAFVTELKETVIADAAPEIVLAANDAGVVSFSELITIEYELVVAVEPLASVKRTVIAKVPAALGVPEITPVLVFSETEPGKDPDAIAYVPLPVPPVTELFSVKVEPTVPVKPELGVAIETEFAVHWANKFVLPYNEVREVLKPAALPDPFAKVFHPESV
jgi:hypothetical protein